MSCLQHKMEKAKSFMPKLEALIDIAENHLHDKRFLRSLEYHMDYCVPGIANMDEIHFAPLVANALTRLSVSRSPVEVVEKLLDLFPSSLEFPSENGLLPLQHAAMNTTTYAKYVHLFVRPSCSCQHYYTRVGLFYNIWFQMELPATIMDPSQLDLMNHLRMPLITFVSKASLRRKISRITICLLSAVTNHACEGSRF